MMDNNIDDADAWYMYPQYRWLFNKLDVAIRLGYQAGPACIPINQSGNYIVRPIYNLYGMGIGAHKLYIDISQSNDMKNHALIPPGYFWCEYFEGNHYSIDYKKVDGVWKPYCTMIGKTNQKVLTKFHSWIKIENIDIDIPKWVNDINVERLNIESIGNRIIEIHLRTGNNMMYNFPIGTKIIPIWEGDSDDINIPNDDVNSRYDASGYLEHVRLGYKIET